MESYSRQNAQSHEVKALLCLGVVIAILAMVNGAMSSKPPARPATAYGKEQFPNYLVDPDAGADRVNVIVKKARGKFNSLSPNEQRWLDSVSAGHGERMVAERWKKEKAEEKKPKPAPHNKSEE